MEGYIEKGPEILPTKEEIGAIFAIFLEGKKNIKELDIKNDERGICFYEVEYIEDNGDKTELNYQTASKNRNLDSGEPAVLASVHKTFYDADGIPVSGACVANYINGQWVYIS